MIGTVLSNDKFVAYEMSAFRLICGAFVQHAASWLLGAKFGRPNQVNNVPLRLT